MVARLKFFELFDNYHPLDYKFYKTRIVNLKKEYTCIYIRGSSTIFKASIIKAKKFPENISFYEDVRLINSYLLVKSIMGLIREAIYYYRKWADFTSITQNHNKDIDFYLYTIKNIHQYLLDSSKMLYNITLPFIQFFIGYDVLYRIHLYAYNFLDSKIYNKYCNIIEILLNQVDDKYILVQKILNYKLKIFALSRKYHKDLRYDIILENKSCLYSNHTLIDFNKNKDFLIWRILEIKDNILHLEGKDNFWMPREKYFYFCKLGNKTFLPTYYHYFRNMFGIIEKGRIVTFDIPLGYIDMKIFHFYISYNDIIFKIFPSLGWFTHIPPINNGYYISDNYFVKYVNKSLNIFIYKKELENLFEKQYCEQLKLTGKNFIIKIRKENIKYRNKIQKNEIWIIIDRPDNAGDNE